jgi:hypothetical protein
MIQLLFLKIPREETVGLALLMRKAVVSIPSDNVEACIRKIQTAIIRFQDTAPGSLTDLLSQSWTGSTTRRD